MTKRDLIIAVCNATPHIPKKTIEEAVSLFFEMVTFYLSHHQRVELRGFGVFSVRTRHAHKAHNPQTGEMLVIPEKVVPIFKPSIALKDLLKKAYKDNDVKKKNPGFFSTLYQDLTGRS
jgi:integration host factor subunit beta